MAGSGALTNRRLADYRLGVLLNEDSFGQVYEALHVHLRRELALRVLSDRFTFAVGFEEHFWRMGRVLATLEHSNLLTMDDYGMDGPYAYLVTPIVEGTTLEDWLREHRADPLGPAQVLRLFGQVVAVLHYLHKGGVTHLGITPSRIWVEPNGHLLLASVGLPYLAEELWQGWSERRAFGNPLYLAPEQLQGPSTSGVACDIYAVGVILYRLLSGVLPFDGASPTLLETKLQGAPPIRQRNPGLPPTVEAVVMRALHPSPQERWPQIAVFAEAFYSALEAAGYARPAGALPGGATRYIAPERAYSSAALPGGTRQQEADDPRVGAPAAAADGRRLSRPVAPAGFTEPYMPTPGGPADKTKVVSWSSAGQNRGVSPPGAPVPIRPAPLAAPVARRNLAGRVLFKTVKILLLPLILAMLGAAIFYGYHRWQQMQQPLQPTSSPVVTPGSGALLSEPVGQVGLGCAASSW